MGPPKHVVVIGLYRFVRNPMYVGLMFLLLGWALVAGSPLLGGYALFFAIAFHLRVVLHEEPRLKQQFAADWSAYTATVPRWLPRCAAKLTGPDQSEPAGGQGYERSSAER